MLTKANEKYEPNWLESTFANIGSRFGVHKHPFEGHFSLDIMPKFDPATGKPFRIVKAVRWPLIMIKNTDKVGEFMNRNTLMLMLFVTVDVLTGKLEIDQYMKISKYKFRDMINELDIDLSEFLQINNEPYDKRKRLDPVDDYIVQLLNQGNVQVDPQRHPSTYILL